MRKLILLMVLFSCVITSALTAQTTQFFSFEKPDQKKGTSTPLVIAPSLDLTEQDRSILQSFQPGIFLGTTGTVKLPDVKYVRLNSVIGVRFFSANDPKTHDDFMRSIVFQGSMNLMLSTAMAWGKEDHTGLRFPVVGFNLKFSPGLDTSLNADSGATSTTLIQHSLSLGSSWNIGNKVQIAGQYVAAWHNATDQSKRNFMAALNRGNTDVSYWLFGLVFKIDGDSGSSGSAETELNNTYFYVEFRPIHHPGRYEGFGESKFFTFGFRKDLSLSF